MKHTKKIIGLLTTLALVINISAPISYAETEPEIDCAKKKPNYTELMAAWNKEETKDQNAYATAFEAAQEDHHDYVGCMFNFAEKTVLGSDGAGSGETANANTPNSDSTLIIGGFIDWMSPAEACLKPKKLKEIIEKSDPSQMLQPILDAHKDYKDHLNTFGYEFDTKGTETNKKGEPFPALQMLIAKSASLGTRKRQRQMEIDSSLLAIDLMFTSLKELRLSFVMHVHFQCTLKYLDKYRSHLEELRDVIEPLPTQLEDASVRK